MDDAHDEFWDRLDDIQAGMLGLTQDGKTVPMSPNLRDDGEDGNIWFITAKGTDLVEGVSAGAQPARFVVADARGGLYANVEGMLALSDDRAVLKDIWSPIASAWFEDDLADDDLRLLCFTPSRAAAWFGPSGVKFIYEIAKANITGRKPDAGDQAELTF